jgi:uncharacterized protein with GYD domain
MAKYVMLINYTDKGIQHFHQFAQRMEHARQGAQELGATIESFYLTMGGYDAVVIFDAPDDETAARIALTNAANGRVRTTTMRAFDEAETVAISEQLPV